MLGPEPVEEDTSIQHTIDVITQELYVIAEGGGSATPLFTLVLGAVIGLIVGCCLKKKGSTAGGSPEEMKRMLE